MALPLPLIEDLDARRVGSQSEIFGDPPFTSLSCIAQAWSVAEVLRGVRFTFVGNPASGLGARS